MQTLKLPDGTDHYVAPEGDGPLEPMTLREIQALLMAFSDGIAEVFGDAFFANIIQLAQVYHDSLPDIGDESSPNVGQTVLDGQHQLDLRTQLEGD